MIKQQKQILRRYSVGNPDWTERPPGANKVRHLFRMLEVWRMQCQAVAIMQKHSTYTLAFLKTEG